MVRHIIGDIIINGDDEVGLKNILGWHLTNRAIALNKPSPELKAEILKTANEKLGECPEILLQQKGA